MVELGNVVAKIEFPEPTLQLRVSLGIAVVRSLLIPNSHVIPDLRLVGTAMATCVLGSEPAT